MNNVSLSKEDILLRLIENDIYSGQLVYGLSDLIHLDANDYHLRLPELVFQLFGYEKGEIPNEISEKYFRLTRKAALSTLGTHWEQVPERALVIYRKMQKLIAN